MEDQKELTEEQNKNDIKNFNSDHGLNIVLEDPNHNKINCVICGIQTEKYLGNKVYSKCYKCEGDLFLK